MKKSEANSDCSMVEKSVEAFSTRFIFCVGLFSLGLGYVLAKLGFFYFSYNLSSQKQYTGSLFTKIWKLVRIPWRTNPSDSICRNSGSKTWDYYNVNFSLIPFNDILCSCMLNSIAWNILIQFGWLYDPNIGTSRLLNSFLCLINHVCLIHENLSRLLNSDNRIIHLTNFTALVIEFVSK